MAQVIVSALYLWLALTAVALVVWIFKRIRGERQAKEAQRVRAIDSILLDGAPPQSTAEKATATKTTAGAADTSESAASAAAAKAPTRSLGSAIASGLSAPSEPSTSEAPPRLDASNDAAKPTGQKKNPTPAPAEPAQKPVEQPAAAETPDDRREAVAEERSLADLLSGIKLPLDLQPLVLDRDDLDVEVMSLISVTAPASAVGGAFADELERLGYEIFSLSETDAVAKRDDDVLSMSIKTDVPADGSSGESGPAVGIDLWVGGGESPLRFS